MLKQRKEFKMKKIMTRMLPLFLLLTLLTVFASPVAFAEETEVCEHVWNEGEVTTAATCTTEGVKTFTCTKCGATKTEAIAKTEHTVEMEVVKQGAVKTVGKAYKKCTVCGRYAKVSSWSSTVGWQGGNTNATQFSYTLPYTLWYKSLDGTVTQIPGNYRLVYSSSSNPDFYGKDGLEPKFLDIPNPDAAPVGYKISTFSANKYAVLENGEPGSSFVPGNPAYSSYPWMNDTDTKYTVISLFVIADPQVSISQEGVVLTANIANKSETLDYTYQWYKNGEAIEGATESTCAVTEACNADAGVYTVEVSVKNAADSNVPLCNSTQVVTVTSAECAAKAPHAWDEGKVMKEATCTQSGEKTYTCKTCGETKTETLPKTEHVEVPEIVEGKEATAKTRGELYVKCSICGGYKWVKDNGIFWPTSSTRATKYYYYKPYTLIYRSLDGTETQVEGTFRGVSVTRDYYGYEGVTMHYPELPYADKAPAGYYISEFEANRYAVLENGVPNHSYVPGNESDNVWAGWLNDTDYTYTIVSLFAMAKPEVSVSQDGAVLTAKIANWNENLAYTYQWYRNGAAIEGATGSTYTVTEKCTEAAAKYSVAVSVTSGENSTIPTLDPTHSETATSAEYTAEVVHTPVEDPAVAATCTEEGKTAGSHCSVCGEVLVAQEVIPATGHAVVTDPAVAATCEETGLTEGSHCSVCGLVIKAQEKIPALGHKYGAWKDAKDGKTHTRVCANDKTHVQSEKHTFGEWKVTKEATKTEKGSKERVCTVCGYKETAVIPALDTAPKTGDETNAVAFILLAVISLMSVACLTVVSKKKA